MSVAPILETHVTGAQAHGPVRQLEPLQDPSALAVSDSELVVGLLGRGELHQLHLVELVLADETAHVGRGTGLVLKQGV